MSDASNCDNVAALSNRPLNPPGVRRRPTAQIGVVASRLKLTAAEGFDSQDGRVLAVSCGLVPAECVRECLATARANRHYNRIVQISRSTQPRTMRTRLRRRTWWRCEARLSTRVDIPAQHTGRLDPAAVMLAGQPSVLDSVPGTGPSGPSDSPSRVSVTWPASTYQSTC